MEFWKHALVMGLAATALIDLWALVRKHLLGTPAPNYGLVGRWLGHMPWGRFHHHSIAAAPAVRGERIIGWTAEAVYVALSRARALLRDCIERKMIETGDAP